MNVDVDNHRGMVIMLITRDDDDDEDDDDDALPSVTMAGHGE